jgi:hypothetical protein
MPVRRDRNPTTGPAILAQSKFDTLLTKSQIGALQQRILSPKNKQNGALQQRILSPKKKQNGALQQRIPWIKRRLSVHRRSHRALAI